MSIIHPSIHPHLVAAAQRVRQRFVDTPEAFHGMEPIVRDGCGCIVAWLKEELCSRGAMRQVQEMFPDSAYAIHKMFYDSCDGESPQWAIERIDKFLYSNT